VAIEVFIGIILGALAGYFRGPIDIAISRFTEIVMCIPTFFLILALVAKVEHPSIFWIMGVLGLTGWTGVMRLVRGEFLRLVGLDFVIAGRALGLSSSRVIFRHVLPNALAPVLVSATFGVAGAILTESSLSFLGFGVPPPTASWGSVLNEAFGAEKEMWWVTVFPGFMIFLTITAYNLVGEGFRDATDPRLRK
jgi:peptide/nickel transport system permease protein